jgi:hypothetical protein
VRARPARQLAAIGAFGVVALWIIGFFLAGKPPKFDGTPGSVVGYYADHHKQILIAAILVAMGLALYLTVLVQLASYLRDRGQWSLAALVLAAGAASAGLFAAGDALYGVIAQAVAAPGADAGVAKALYMFDQFAGMAMYWLVLPIILSVTVAAARGVFPRWAVWTSGLFAALVALGGICVKADGAFAAGTGPIANLAFGAALVFLLEVGLLLWNAAEAAPAQITA